MATKHFRKRISKEDFDTAIEFMYAKNPTISKLMKRLDLEAQVLPGETITGKELEKLSVSKNKNKLNNKVMAVKEKENNNNVYLKPYQGAFRKYVKVATSKSVVRLNSKKEPVNEELFSEASGKIKKIYSYDKDLGTGKDIKFLVIYLKEDNEKDFTVIETAFSQSFAQSFLMRLENIDLSKPVILRPYTIKNEEKTKEKGKDIFNDLLIPYQLDAEGKAVKVEAFWSKTNQGELPQMQEIKGKKGGTSIWNSVERDEFLEGFVVTISDKIKLLSESKESITSNVATADIEKDVDDLPF